MTRHLTRDDVAGIFTAVATARGNGLAFDDAAADVQRIALLMSDMLNGYRDANGCDPEAVQLAAGTMDAAFRLGYARQPWVADVDDLDRVIRDATVRYPAEQTYHLLAAALIEASA